MSLISETILSLLYIILFILIIYKLKFFTKENINLNFISALFILKLLSGFALLLVYTFYYTDHLNSDIYKYFDDSLCMYNALYSKPLDFLRMLTGIGDGDVYFKNTYYSHMNFWYKEWDYHLFNDNRTIIRLNALFRLVSFGSIYVHTIFMVFISFIGLFYIYKLFSKLITINKYILITSINLLPGVIFWTSGVLKEGLLIFAFGIMLYKFYKLLNQFKILDFTIFIITIYILSITKFYVLIAAIPSLIAIFWLSKTSYKKPFLKFVIVHLIFFIIGLSSNYVVTVIHKKQVDFVASLEDADVGSFFEIPRLEPNALNIIKNTPLAIYNTLARPYVFESSSIVILLAAFENLLIIALIVIALIFNRLNHINNKSWFYFCLFFVLIIFALSGLVTPVMGALVRYKVPALPFLMILILFIVDFEKLTKYLKIRLRKSLKTKTTKK